MYTLLDLAPPQTKFLATPVIITVCAEHIDLRKTGRNVSVSTNYYLKHTQNCIKASIYTIFLSIFPQLWIENTS